MPPPVAPLVSLGMALLALLVAALLAIAIARARRPHDPPGGALLRGTISATLLLAWLAATAALAASGRLADFEARPPPLFLLMGVTLLCTLTLAASPLGARLAEGLPLWALVGLQSFRLPLELVMHEAALAGVMPPQMSFGGLNFDVLSGTLALLLAPLIARGRAPRGAVVAFQLVGSLLLLAIGGIAIASTPLVQAFGDAPARLNTWVAYAPYVWLPALLFPTALLLHLLLARRLFARGAS